MHCSTSLDCFQVGFCPAVKRRLRSILLLQLSLQVCSARCCGPAWQCLSAEVRMCWHCCRSCRAGIRQSLMPPGKSGHGACSLLGQDTALYQARYPPLILLLSQDLMGIFLVSGIVCNMPNIGLPHLPNT